MDHFAELDVSVKETSICIVDETGRIVREVEGPRCRFRREARARERHRHCSGG